MHVLTDSTTISYRGTESDDNDSSTDNSTNAGGDRMGGTALLNGSKTWKQLVINVFSYTVYTQTGSLLSCSPHTFSIFSSLL